MARNDDTKMDELKRLLKRLDSVESGKGPGKNSEAALQEQRDYVGALRGAPELDLEAPASKKVPPKKLSTGSVAVLTAVIAAIVSSFAVYVIMTKGRDGASLNLREAPANTGIVPSKLETSPSEKGSDANGTSTPGDIKSELVRRAKLLREQGNDLASLELLKQAADLGSGIAALELAKRYEAARADTPAETERNAAAALAWYQRARALGINETASEASASGAR